MDNATPAKRSRNMAAIRCKDTKPELVIRSRLHSLGLRFRLHCKDLPGRPDIILPKYKTVILVNGCFWHQHIGCKLSHWPKSREEYWKPKLNRTVTRDQENEVKLKNLGWNVIVVWECEIKDKVRLEFSTLPNLITALRNHLHFQ